MSSDSNWPKCPACGGNAIPVKIVKHTDKESRIIWECAKCGADYPPKLRDPSLPILTQKR
jgi:uncharacterized Zn finger protein